MSVLSASLFVAAMRSDGYHATNVELNDGVVWVYNNAPNRQFVSRINTQTAEAESGFDAGGTIDIKQDGATVYALTSATITAFNPATTVGTIGDNWPLDAAVGLGGGVGALLTRDSGNVWVTQGLTLGNWKADIPPTVKVAPGSLLTVSPTGVAIVVDPSTDEYIVIRLDEKGVAVASATQPFGGDVADGLDAITSITSIGDKPVILDEQGLLLPGGRRVVAAALGGSPALQEPGASADSVLVASDNGILQVDLSDGKVTTLLDGGHAGAARPIRIGRCVSAAWTVEPGTFAQQCAGRDDVVKPIPSYSAGSSLQFRSNSGGLVLSGQGDEQWVVRDGQLILVENWDQVDPNLIPKDDQTETAPSETEDETQRTCDPKPVAPIAKANAVLTFGAKPSNTIVIDAIGLFDDANCDPLSVIAATSSADVEGQSSLVTPINFGQSLQFLAPDQQGDVTIEFTISDGLPEHDTTGTLTVSVVDDSSHMPELRNLTRQPRTTVQQSKSVDYNVLVDWTDKDGDALTLLSASVSATDGRLVFGADGLITYSAETTTGEKIISVEVQDEAGNVSPGTLEVVVQPAGTPIAPVARDDYSRARIGQQVSVRPLQNDTDANGDLASANVPREGLKPELTISGPDSDGVVLLSASAAGTYIIPYTARDAQGKTSTAAIRLDVVADEQTNGPPVAVRDAVVVRPGRTVNVDVLSNDSDPDGDVLAVTDARLADPTLSEQGISVVVIERRFVRVIVSAGGAPNPTFIVKYTITDGVNDPVRGELKVTVPATLGNQPPIVQRDEAVVRVNQVVSINVLSNDRDPDGDQLFIRPGSVKFAQAGTPGFVWLDGTTVRFKAGTDVPTANVIIQYAVEDDPNLSGLQPVAGTISIRVLGDDDKHDPPVPKPGELRVFTDATATFRVPLSGIDADGDLAILAPSLADFPTQGTAVVKGDSIVYTAGPDSGPDQFSYTVSDRFGLQGIGVVRVVIADGSPHSPVPINDRLRTRPGRLVSVDVLANDTDPDGDEVLIGAVASRNPALVASKADTRVEVQVPDAEGTYLVTYDIYDARSTDPQTGVLTIIADADAAFLAPITRDDPDGDKSPAVVRQVPDASGAMVTVTEIKVAGNDDDPDGSPSALVVEVAAGQKNDAAALAPLPAGVIRVAMTNDVQWVVYTATDPDGNTSSAVATIQPDQNRPPVCPAADRPIAEVSIPGGQPAEIVLADHVVDPEDDLVQLQGVVPTVVSGAGEVIPVPNDYSRFTYAPSDSETLDQVVIRVPIEDRKGDDNSQKIDCPMLVSIKRTNEPPTVKDASFSVQQVTDGVVSLGNLSNDLGLVVDKDAGDTLVFTQDDGAPQNKVTLTISDNGDLAVSADLAPVGLDVTFGYTVTDNQPTTPAPVTGKVILTIVGTTKPMPVVQSFNLDDKKQGEVVTQDVSVGSYDPFLPDHAMTFEVDPNPIEGRGTVGAMEGASTVSFTPAPDFYGRAVVRYTATDYVKRQVTGTITYTVIGKPLTPGQPTVSEVSSRRAVLSWAPADPQGTPITDYIVRWPGGEKSAGTATTVTIDTLTNGTPVQFTVIARNKVGDSEPSSPSGSVLPDQIPGKPQAPVITDFGDKTLTVTWVEPVIDGTSIIRYDLYSSAGGAPEPRPATERSFVWTALSNGTPYTFTIVAVNSAGASDRSDSSNSLSPATIPSPPAGPNATDAGNGIEQRLTVTWVAPADNGRPISGYILTDTITSQVYDFSGNPATTQSVIVGDLEHRFSVVAVNAVGPSLASAAGSTVWSPRKPAIVTLISADDNLDRSTTLNFVALTGAATGNCLADVISYEYSINGGIFLPLAANRQINYAFENGTQYSVRARGKNCKYTGDPSTSVNFTPSGPPIGANIGVSGLPSGNSINWSWNANGAFNGLSLTSVTLSGAAGGTFGVSGSTTSNHSCDQEFRLTVTVTDANGRQGSNTSAAVRTAACPPPGMLVTTNARTCPEDNGTLPDHFTAASGGNPATCSSPLGFIANATTLRVTCRQDNWPALAVGRWLYIYSGAGYEGWYVADFTVNENTDALPGC